MYIIVFADAMRYEENKTFRLAMFLKQFRTKVSALGLLYMQLKRARWTILPTFVSRPNRCYLYISEGSPLPVIVFTLFRVIFISPWNCQNKNCSDGWLPIDIVHPRCTFSRLHVESVSTMAWTNEHISVTTTPYHNFRKSFCNEKGGYIFYPFS